MRFGPIAIAASAIAHVVVMQVVDAIDPPPPPPREPAAVRVSIATVPPGALDPIEPMVVDLVPATAPAAAPAPAVAAAAPAAATTRDAARPRATQGGDAALATASATAVAVEPGAPGEPAGPGGTGILSMRRAALPRLGALGVAVDIAGGAPPPPPIEPSGELEPAGNGTSVSKHGGFDARVARNGDVTFADKPAFNVGLTLPSPRAIARDAARGVERWFDDPGAAIRAADRDPSRAESREDLAVPGAAVRSDTMPPPMVTVSVLGGNSEITDWVMRRAGIDPYASAKRDFLERTRDERMAMRINRESQLPARAEATMRKHLAGVWRRTDLPAAARREAIFELWDECVEDGDEEKVDAGNRARSAVVGFVRAHLPAGSADAYSADELAALNRRRTSKAPFAPYE